MRAARILAAVTLSLGAVGSTLVTVGSASANEFGQWIGPYTYFEECEAARVVDIDGSGQICQPRGTAWYYFANGGWN